MRPSPLKYSPTLQRLFWYRSRPKAAGAAETRSGFEAPVGLQDLAIFLFVLLAGLMIGGALLMWMLRIPPFG